MTDFTELLDEYLTAKQLYDLLEKQHGSDMWYRCEEVCQRLDKARAALNNAVAVATRED